MIAGAGSRAGLADEFDETSNDGIGRGIFKLDNEKEALITPLRRSRFGLSLKLMLNSLQQCNQIDWKKGNGPTDVLTVPASIASCGDNVVIGLGAKTTVPESPVRARTGEGAIRRPFSLSEGNL